MTTPTDPSAAPEVATLPDDIALAITSFQAWCIEHGGGYGRHNEQVGTKRAVLESAIRALTTRSAAAERVVAAAERWAIYDRGNQDFAEYDAACDELGAAVAAYRGEGGR